MNSCKRYTRAITFSGPDRVPVDRGSGPENTKGGNTLQSRPSVL